MLLTIDPWRLPRFSWLLVVFTRWLLSSGYSDPYCQLGLMRRNDETAIRLADGSAEECSTVLSPVALMAGIIGDVRFFNVSALRRPSSLRVPHASEHKYFFFFSTIRLTPTPENILIPPINPHPTTTTTNAIKRNYHPSLPIVYHPSKSRAYGGKFNMPPNSFNSFFSFHIAFYFFSNMPLRETTAERNSHRV